MTNGYFRARHNLRNEQSGYQEVSEALRERLSHVTKGNMADEYNLGVGNEGLWVGERALGDELQMHLLNGSIFQIIATGSYDRVFEAIEIFLNRAKQDAGHRYEEILSAVKAAFKLSGSVYYVADRGKIELVVDEELAKEIAQAEETLNKTSEKASEKFSEAMVNLLRRNDKPKNIIRDIYVALETFLKEQTQTKNFSDAISKLVTLGAIVPAQRALLNKLYAYRSTIDGAVHGTGFKEPEELDAMWYFKTIMPWFEYIQQKLKS